MRRACLTAAATVLLLLCVASDAEANCSISTTGVNFGVYDVFASVPVDSTGSVRYQCSGSTGNIAITISQGASGTFNSRAMMVGSDALTYNLYLDAARTTIWGDGTAGTGLFTLPNVTGKPVTLTIFGRIPAGQDVAAGSYSDSVLVTIQF